MTEYKLDVCCNQMDKEIRSKTVIQIERGLQISAKYGTVYIDFCPWCGKHIRFKREYGWDEE